MNGGEKGIARRNSKEEQQGENVKRGRKNDEE